MDAYLTTPHGALFAGDCLKLMAVMKPQIFDCIFADPPFNLGKDYGNGFNDQVGQAEYLDWCQHWINEGARLLKPGGAFFIYALPELAVKFAHFMSERLTFRHWIALTMKGTYSRGRKLYPAHYALLYFTRGEPKTFNRLRVPVPTCRHCGKEIKDYGGHRDKLNPRGLNLTDFWEDTSPNRHKRYKVRPGVNELKLMIPERAILISTDPGDFILDPFGGGGSTYQAAEFNHRRWIGIELYDCAHIRMRLEENLFFGVGQPPTFNVNDLFLTNEDYKDHLLQRVTG
jgi:site-specific DNA-methyltransferase (adenine-specific)